MRGLVAANVELKLHARRAKAKIAVLTAEFKGLEEHFLLRTPAPSPMPAEGHISGGSSYVNLGAAFHSPGLEGRDVEKTQARPSVTQTLPNFGVNDDGNIDRVDRVQYAGEGKSGGDLASSGRCSWAITGLDESKAGVLSHTFPNGVVDHSESKYHRIRAPGRGQVDSAASGCSQSTEYSCNQKQGSVGVLLGGRNLCCSKAAGGVALGSVLHASEHGDDGDPGSQNNCGGERDAGNWDSRGLANCTRGARSRPRKGRISEYTYSNKCDAHEKNFASGVSTINEQERQDGGPAEPSDGASCSEQVAAAPSSSQATSSALDDAPNLEVTRPGNGHDGLSQSLPPQHTGARSGPINILLGDSIGDSGTNAVASTNLPDPLTATGDGGHTEAQSRRKRTVTSTPESKVAVESQTSPARYGERSACEAESTMRRRAEDTSDDEDGVQVTIEIPPRGETCSIARQPSSKRRQQGDEPHHIMNRFLDDSCSQSSSDSRSPGG